MTFEHISDEGLQELVVKAHRRLHRGPGYNPPYLTTQEHVRVQRLLRAIEWEQDRRWVARVGESELAGELALLEIPAAEWQETSR